MPELHGRPGGAVTIDPTPPIELLARLAELPASEVERRLAEQNRAYLLRVDDQPASYGWSASGPAEIGGLDLHFEVPPGERYLWDFATLPAFRGRGLYPWLLEEILKRERAAAEWFWIGHEPRNEASRRGILKAGFVLAGQVRRTRDGLVFVPCPLAAPDFTARAAQAMGLRLAEDVLTTRGAEYRVQGAES